MFNDLFDSISNIRSNSTDYQETWGGIEMKGRNYNEFQDHVSTLFKSVRELALENSIKLHVDGVQNNNVGNLHIDAESNWKININKLRIPETKINDCFYQIFYSKDEFLNWANKIDPFNSNCPLNLLSPLKIIINGLEDSFGGPNLLFTRNTSDGFAVRDMTLPSWSSINQTVHFVSATPLQFEPLQHLITFGSVENEYAKPFLKNSGLVLSACLVNEFYSPEKIILRGVKRVQMKLASIAPNIDINFILLLTDVVSWIYEDKTETRIKLLVDRLTLDLDYDKPYLDELLRIVDSAFQQAKERYNFVIIDRKDNYLKELRELLKDIKVQSDLYSSKIRSLLSNLMRDVLAGFLLVGFSFFTKVSEMSNLIKQEDIVNIVFRGFAVYFLLSAIVQTIIDITDLNVSKKEMLYWKNVSREFIPEKEFTDHINMSLAPRKCSIYMIYPLIIIIYLLIALICWYFPQIWVSINKISA